MEFRTNPNRPELNATKIPTPIDIAWSAGIYEGEGSCRLSNKSIRALQATVTQKDPELLYRLRDWFGGSVHDNGAGIRCYVWDVCGDRARLFLAVIYSYMTARRKSQIDAIRALDFLCAENPGGISIENMKDKLIDFNQTYILTLSENPELRKAKQKAYYEKSRVNPEEVEKQRERNRIARSKQTPEQMEAKRKYMQEYNKTHPRKDRKPSTIHVVEIEKTA